MDANCPTRWTLFFAWVHANGDKEDRKAEYSAHFKTCPVCSADRRRMNEAAKTAIHPELSEREE